VVLVSAAVVALASSGVSLAEVARAPVAPRLAEAVAIERIALPAGEKLTAVVEPLDGSIELRGARRAATLAAMLGGVVGQICPEVRLAGAAVVMRCRTRRLDARLVSGGGRLYLDIQELRGLPWREEADRLRVPYDPERVGLGGPCPGTTAEGRAECAFQQGDRAHAAIALRLALGPRRSLAALRLGDLALEAQDMASALSWFRQAGVSDDFGRLAAARLCELGGGCLGGSWKVVFTTSGLPEPLATEMELRTVRLIAYEGRLEEAARRLRRVIVDGGANGMCATSGSLFCRRLLLYLLTNADESAAETLDAYLSMPARDEGPLRFRLVAAAAERAAQAGAPVFGGNLLSASAAWVGEDALESHLLRAAELYVLGKDRARARVVLDYAESRLARRRLAAGRWAALRRETRPDAGPSSGLTTNELQITEGLLDVAGAYRTLARLRRAR